MNASNDDIEGLRSHLFDTIRSLKDKEKPMELERAQTIANVAQVIINSAKAEVDFLKATGRKKGSKFIPVEENSLLQKPEGTPSPKLKEPDRKGYTGKLQPGNG